MTKKLFEDYQPDPDDDPIETETFVLRFTLDARYSSAEHAAKEVAESVEWMSPQYGSHHGILQVELLEEGEEPGR